MRIKSFRVSVSKAWNTNSDKVGYIENKKPASVIQELARQMKYLICSPDHRNVRITKLHMTGKSKRYSNRTSPSIELITSKHIWELVKLIFYHHIPLMNPKALRFFFFLAGLRVCIWPLFISCFHISNQSLIFSMWFLFTSRCSDEVGQYLLVHSWSGELFLRIDSVIWILRTNILGRNTSTMTDT